MNGAIVHTLYSGIFQNRLVDSVVKWRYFQRGSPNTADCGADSLKTSPLFYILWVGMIQQDNRSSLQSSFNNLNPRIENI